MFSLLEVWHGARLPSRTVVAESMRIVTAFVYSSGYATSGEHETPPDYFDPWQALWLAGQLPKTPATGTDEQLEIEAQFMDGNVDILSFSAVLWRICARARKASDIHRWFVDLGSGCGLAVLAAHFLFPLRTCTGYALMESRLRAARKLTQKYMSSGFDKCTVSSASLEGLFECGDILNMDWSDASVVFCNAVTWPLKMVQRVGQLAMHLRRGAVLLIARPLPNDSAVLDVFDVRSDACLGSWTADPVHLWVYQRL